MVTSASPCYATIAEVGDGSCAAHGYTPITTSEYSYVEALVFVDASRVGHSLDAALVIGGAYPGVIIDDVVVSAPPIIGAG